MSVTNQKNIFIDTEQYHGSDNKVRLLFPSQTLVVPQGFGMKLSLQQFTMKKSFYNINKYNNTLYVYNSGTNSYTEIVIAEGDYYEFGRLGTDAESLCKAIEDAFNLVLGAASTGVSYNVNTRKLSITNPSFSITNYIVCFQVPPSRQTIIPANTTPNGLFSDVAEILGAKSNQADLSGLIPFPAFELASTTFTSFYPASLYSMENIRLLVNLGNTNLETPNMDANSSTSICLTSQTFATIPLQTGTFDGLNLIEPAIITYQDDGDELFSLKLQQNHIDNCTFSLVDGKGRPIDEVSKDQYKNGELNYQMVLRWEVIEEPYVANPSNYPSSNRTGNLLPKLI